MRSQVTKILKNDSNSENEYFELGEVVSLVLDGRFWVYAGAFLGALIGIVISLFFYKQIYVVTVPMRFESPSSFIIQRDLKNLPQLLNSEEVVALEKTLGDTFAHSPLVSNKSHPFKFEFAEGKLNFEVAFLTPDKDGVRSLDLANQIEKISKVVNERNLDKVKKAPKQLASELDQSVDNRLKQVLKLKMSKESQFRKQLTQVQYQLLEIIGKTHSNLPTNLTPLDSIYLMIDLAKEKARKEKLQLLEQQAIDSISNLEVIEKEFESPLRSVASSTEEQSNRIIDEAIGYYNIAPKVFVDSQAFSKKIEEGAYQRTLRKRPLIWVMSIISGAMLGFIAFIFYNKVKSFEFKK